jgi:hypothetical protein
MDYLISTFLCKLNAKNYVDIHAIEFLTHEPAKHQQKHFSGKMYRQNYLGQDPDPDVLETLIRSRIWKKIAWIRNTDGSTNKIP